MTHLSHVLVELVNGLVGVLLNILGRAVKLVRSILAVLLKLVVDSRSFAFCVTIELVYLALSLLTECFGILLHFLA